MNRFDFTGTCSGSVCRILLRFVFPVGSYVSLSSTAIRDHSIAFMEAKGAPKRINHFMLECNSLLDVGIGRDLCTQRGVPIGIDLGCHMNDRMVSFYLANPSGFAVEYGWGGRVIDDSVWQVEHYDTVESIWGHPELKAMVANMAAAAAGSGQ